MIVRVQAEHRSSCENCDYGIRPGQQIVLDDSNADPEWVHEQCPTAPAVCGECFTEVARNGACLCGAV